MIEQRQKINNDFLHSDGRVLQAWSNMLAGNYEGISLSISKINTHSKHIGMSISPEIFVEDGQLFKL